MHFDYHLLLGWACPSFRRSAGGKNRDGSNWKSDYIMAPFAQTLKFSILIGSKKWKQLAFTPFCLF